MSAGAPGNHAAAGAARRVATGWKSLLLVVLSGAALVLFVLLVSFFERSVPPSGDEVVTLSSARVVVTTDGVRRESSVALPYRWDAENPGRRGIAVFTLAVDLRSAPRGAWALQLPVVGNAYEVRLNGQLRERRGRLDHFGGNDYSHLPRFVPLGFGLHEGSNELTIAIRADAERGAGLSKVIVGPYSEVRDDFERRYRWLFGTSAGVAGFGLATGLLCLGLWAIRAGAPAGAVHRDEALYLYAAVAEFSAAYVTGAMLLSSPPIPWPWWGVASILAMGAAIAFTAMFCAEAAGWSRSAPARMLRNWLVALLLACAPSAYVALGLGAGEALNLWFFALATTVVGFGGVFAVRAVRDASLEHRLLAFAILANLVAGAHDLYVFRVSPDYLHATMLVYSSVLFDLTLGFIVIVRFYADAARAAELTRTLSARVADKERELESNYQRLEQLAREQERTNERASILRDMHDGVGAHISMAIRQIESGRLQKADLLPPLRDSLDHLKLTIDSMNLPPGDVASLLGTFRYRLGPRIEASGMRLHWNVESIAPVERLDSQAMRQLMFILFEAVSNTLQHSRASDLRIDAAEAGGVIRLRIVDNGVGFDAAAAPEKGLLSMRARAERLGSLLEIRSSPGETAVELEIPRN